MSLWTPSGEHEVPRDHPQTTTPAGDDWRERLAAGELDLDDLTDEQRAEVEEVVAQMAQTQQQLLDTPVAHLIAQHLVGLREIVILHLQQDEPDLPAAQTVIDAIAGLVEAISGRLGELEQPFRAELQQLQMAFLSRQEDTSADV